MRIMRSPLCALVVSLILLGGCGEAEPPARSASAPTTQVSEATTLAGARVEARQIVRETVASVASGLPVEDAPGLGYLHCDPQGSGLMDWSFSQIIDVRGADLDEVAGDAWGYWQELGFVWDGGELQDAHPDLNARRGDFLGELVGDREAMTLRVSITTPCLPRDVGSASTGAP